MQTESKGFVQRLMRTRRSEKAQALPEYALILALIAVVALFSLQALGMSVTDQIGNVVAALGDGGGGGGDGGDGDGGGGDGGDGDGGGGDGGGGDGGDGGDGDGGDGDGGDGDGGD